MAIAEIFLWWYSQGWSVFIHKIQVFLTNTADFFSMSSLIRTLFQPFRQISAESADADSSLDLKFHMFIDRLVSRIVGFFTRLILLFVGCLIIIIGSIICLVLVILWPFIPFLPIAGIVLSVIGATL
ncbi:MAG: hypothetical protein Q4F56_00485 [Candidatus Saccharibacteria bacterium]|nr:hypothetical protein [Candidatus Saccharibacteria bacterium]